VTKGKRSIMDDAELLREYVKRQSDTAFAELVRRHVNLVYSTAFRMVRETALAEDIVQSVFVQLARKASMVREGNALPGWLYRVTHCQAANALRAERSRRQREAQAMIQAQLDIDTAWEHIECGLEEAMGTLSADEQTAVVMRFFQEHSWRDVSRVLALSEDTAQRRVGRALEKLRAHFARRGIAVSASVIGLTLAANAVQAAPAGLASTVAAASLAGAASTGVSAIAVTLKALLMKKATLGILTGVVITAAVTVPLAISENRKAQANAPITEKTLTRGLVVHMPFNQDETISGKVTDASGRGNHGKASGVRWTAEGKKGGAYEFTADGDQIEVPNHKSLNPKQLTLAVWIKTTTADGKWRRIFDKSYSKGYALSIAADWQTNKWNGLASLEIGPGTHFSLTKSMVADGQWHHVVGTFNGTEQLLFVDGKPESKALVWGKPVQVGNNDFNLVIGCNRSNPPKDGLGESFRGLIDEPMMWNRALTSNEVAFLFESQR
jgi:RNA polymerase sigma factor (sigma-70 family)